MKELRSIYRRGLAKPIATLKAAAASLGKSPQSLETIQDEAHTLQGSGATYGFPEISAAASAVEAASPESLQLRVQEFINVLLRVQAGTDTAEMDQHPESLEPLPQADNQQPLLERRILLAEDDEHIARIIAKRMEAEGFIVIHTRDGEAALTLAKRMIPEVCILDVKMPRMDGFELLIRLRALPGFKKIPILLLTTLSKKKDVLKGIELGANDYLVKPFRPYELVGRVRQLIQKQ
jgi:CheY-like chemotaxis protein